MRLYYHKTDGGAEYLCSDCVEGTEEGSFNSKYIVRIDGDIEKDAELSINEDKTEVFVKQFNGVHMEERINKFLSEDIEIVKILGGDRNQYGDCNIFIFWSPKR